MFPMRVKQGGNVTQGDKIATQIKHDLHRLTIL